MYVLPFFNLSFFVAAVLKNDLDKYREWMQERFNDIVKKFIQFFAHPKAAVGQCALKSLLTIIQHFAWQHNKFPEELYKVLFL